MKQSTKFLLEIGPLLVFFLAYRVGGLIPATFILVVGTVISVFVNYAIEQKIPVMPVVSAVILTIFGVLTVVSQDEIYIKMKPTIINCLFAAILLGGLLIRKGLLKFLMQSTITMEDAAWKIFSFRWAVFFLFLAGVNECVWRNFSTDFWVAFKVFGMVPLTLVFMGTQIPFLKKHAQLER